MKISIVHKLSFSAALLVILTTALIGSLLYSKTTTLLVNNALDNITQQNKNIGVKLISIIETAQQDVKVLAKTPPIQKLLNAGAGSINRQPQDTNYRTWAERLEIIFASMLESKPNYLKLSYIAKDGQELVVVKREAGQIVVLKNKELQSKFYLEQLKSTLSFPLDGVYLSEINLNRERGVVATPYREVLRAATPIYDTATSNVAGMVVLTTEIGYALRDIQKFTQNENSKIYITNDHGGYLLHPSFSKAYGFDLGKRYRIQEDIPLLSKFFIPHNKSTKTTLLPSDTGDEQVIRFIKVHFDSYRPERFIAIGISQNHTSIANKQTALLNDIILSSIGLSFLVALIAAFLAYRLSLPIRRITKTMDDYIHNGYSTEITPFNSNDEIGMLSRSYTSLIGQIEDGRNELKSVNKHLESILKERTRDLEGSDLRQRSIVENMVDGLIIIDEIGTIQSFNPAASTIFGYQSYEVIGQNIKMLMPNPYHDEHDNYLSNYKRTSIRKIIGIGRELEGCRKDGSVFPLDLAVSELHIDGEHLYLGTLRDITERKQIEKMKTEFVSTVSHELRTPLTAIRGSLGLITGGALGKLPEKVNGMLTIAGNNTQRLLLLINDILDIQKIESGNMEFAFQKVLLTPFIEQALQDNEAYGEEYDVKFVMTDSITDATIFVDKDRLMQVITNLLSNSAKFSNKGATVELSVTRLLGNMIRISVIDQGCGIPKEFHPKLFDKFTQSDSSDTRQIGGTGLGLSISKAITEKLGGTLSFVSTEGIGTSFFIDFKEIPSHH